MSTESSDIKAISEKLSKQAWAMSSNFFEPNLLRSLYEEIRGHENDLPLAQSSIGNNGKKAHSPLRGDSTLWLDDPRCGKASKNFFAVLDELRVTLNESLMLGLETVEAHFAIYPVGAAYVRHRDRFRDDDARVLSMVCYLNSDWPDDAGGALRLHLPAGQYDIAPKLGTSVLFLSEEVEHEVMPSTQTRYSIAAWFRQREMQLR